MPRRHCTTRASWRPAARRSVLCCTILTPRPPSPTSSCLWTADGSVRPAASATCVRPRFSRTSTAHRLTSPPMRAASISAPTALLSPHCRGPHIHETANRSLAEVYRRAENAFGPNALTTSRKPKKHVLVNRDAKKTPELALREATWLHDRTVREHNLMLGIL